MIGVVDRWLDSDPGHPLGYGYPGGSPLREDGESHRAAWMRLLRSDPCAYCHRPGPAGTLDHIEPRCRPARAPGGAHCWTNYTGACGRCNAAKADRPLLVFLAARRGVAAPLESHDPTGCRRLARPYARWGRAAPTEQDARC